MEFRHASRIIGPFAYVGGSVFVGAGVEKRSQDVISHGNFFNISRIGFSWNDHGTGIGTGLIGASFPPMGSRFAVIQGKSIGFSANREGFQQLGAYLKEFFGAAPKAGSGSQCRELILGSR